MSEEEIQFSLILNVEDAFNNANKLKTILYRGAKIVQKMTGRDPNIQAAINNAKRLLALLNRVRIVAIAIQTALTMGLGGFAGKIATVFAAVAVAETAIDIVEYSNDDSIYDSTWGA